MERRIKVWKLASNNECIRFYSNKAPDWYCEGKIIDEEKASISWKNEKSSLGNTKGIRKIVTAIGYFYVERILDTYLKLLSIIIIAFIIAKLCQLEYLTRHVFEAIALIVGLTSVYMEIFLYMMEFPVAQKYRTSKYCAIIKMKNVLEKLQRLPNNLKEIQEMSAFLENYGDYEEERMWKARGKSILNGFSLIVVASIVFLVEMSLQTTVIVLLVGFLVVRKSSYYFLLEYLTSKMRAFSQRKFIENEPEEDDLLLAWIVAEEWMKEEYPEYFQED